MNKQGRSLMSAVYALVTAVALAVRLVWAVCMGADKTSGDIFTLIVCSIGLITGTVGGIYLLIKAHKMQHPSSEQGE